MHSFLKQTFFIFAGVYLTVIPFSAEGALLYFDPDVSKIYRGDTTSVKLRIDVDADECINTIDAVIHYDDSIRAVDVSRGSSILNIWLEDPVIDENTHTITFAGGITSGYCGRIPGDPSLTNEIIELLFRSPGLSVGGKNDAKVAEVRLGDATQVLLHDGEGSNANVTVQSASIELLETPGSSGVDVWREQIVADTDAPSDFVVTLTREEHAFSGKFFITFNSSDKQSGIDHYEVMEEPFTEFYNFTWGRADAPWKSVKSPYVLEDQSLNSTIRVKAIDKAGNERISVLVPEEAQRSVSVNTILSIAFAVFLIVMFVGLVVFAIIMYRKRTIAQHSSNSATHE